jgi:hypothetical protein
MITPGSGERRLSWSRQISGVIMQLVSYVNKVHDHAGEVFAWR